LKNRYVSVVASHVSAGKLDDGHLVGNEHAGQRWQAVHSVVTNEAYQQQMAGQQRDVAISLNVFAKGGGAVLPVKEA
jgi:hypothetical protein